MTGRDEAFMRRVEAALERYRPVLDKLAAYDRGELCEHYEYPAECGECTPTAVPS